MPQNYTSPLPLSAGILTATGHRKRSRDLRIVSGSKDFQGKVLRVRKVRKVLKVQRLKSELKFDPALDAMLARDTETIVAMPLKAPRFDHLRKAGDLPARIRREIETFFVAVTALEGKDVRILGWGGPEAIGD